MPSHPHAWGETTHYYAGNRKVNTGEFLSKVDTLLGLTRDAATEDVARSSLLEVFEDYPLEAERVLQGIEARAFDLN